MTCFPFPINIVKQENGNIFIYNANTGDFVKSLSPDIIKIECNENGIVKVTLDNGSAEYFDPNLVLNTQILPDLLIPFIGDCTDLSELLSQDIFVQLNSTNIISYNVTGGTVGGTQPTFSGSPMFYGNYVLMGKVCYFDIQVDFDNILTFGTGQYYVDLPFDCKFATQMRDGCVHDISTGRQYSIGGHVHSNDKQLLLNYIGTNGRDEPFEHNQPFVLDNTDNFHISGIYIINI